MARLQLLRLFGWSLKLHIFLRSDGDVELHDHPWSFFSLVLAGGYLEQTEKGIIARKAGSLCYRPAKWRHRVLLEKSPNGTCHCATLVLSSQDRREWGFWRAGRFIPWREFVSSRKC